MTKLFKFMGLSQYKFLHDNLVKTNVKKQAISLINR
jgi:hypothetical protein